MSILYKHTRYLGTEDALDEHACAQITFPK